jgi:DNA-binding CsgD family transcriptional regulator
MTFSTAKLDPRQQLTSPAIVSTTLVSTTLSDRELQVIDLVADGQTNQEIAAILAISKRTVDNHISNILNKTKTDNRVALVRWALQSGKVCIDQVNCCNIPIAQAIIPLAVNSSPIDYVAEEDGDGLERA